MTAHARTIILEASDFPRIGPDPSYTDIDLMLRLWNTDRDDLRNVALEMADNDRKRAGGRK